MMCYNIKKNTDGMTDCLLRPGDIDMLSDRDRQVIIKCAKKYNVAMVILFGSAREVSDANDIDIGVKGLAPEHFFEFGWESCRDLSKPVDVIDLDDNCLFSRLAEKDGEVIYG